MNWYRKYVSAAKVQPKDDDFSWSYIEVPEEVMKLHRSFTKTIEKNDLYIEEAKGGDYHYGIETDVHITLVYGFTFDNPKQVVELLDGEDGGEVNIDGIEVFEKDDYDVLVIRCKSKRLGELHRKLIDGTDTEDKYPEYKPHMTIAYFKKGKAKKYKPLAEKRFLDKDIEFSFDKVFFEDTEDKTTKIDLG